MKVDYSKKYFSLQEELKENFAKKNRVLSSDEQTTDYLQ